MSDTDLQAEFARRVRRHMMVLPLMVLAFAVPLSIGSFLKRVYWHKHPPHGFNVAIAIVIAAAFVVTIGYGFWSTWKNLRCPKCETNVWYMVSQNASLVFVSDEGARTHCPRCDAEIVGPILLQRTKRLMVATLVGGLLFSIAGIAIRAIFGT